MPSPDEKARHDFEDARLAWTRHSVDQCITCRRVQTTGFGRLCKEGAALKREMLRAYRITAAIEGD